MRDRTMSRLGRTVQQHRRAAAADDGVAMVIVLMLIMVILGLTVTLVSTLVAQPPAIYLAQRRTKTIYAAQAGIQAAVGQLRSTPTYTSGGKTYATPADLPCSVSGSVDGSSSYSAAITYYNADPTGQSASWLAASANVVTCTVGSGTTSTPTFALIRSTGTGPSVPALAATAGVRTLQAIYQLNVSNVNIPGGPILDRGQGFCLTAPASPTVGSTITFVPVAAITATQTKLCPTPATQNWVYNSSYQLQLASTVGSSPGLCIVGTSSATINATLGACSVTPIQQWAWEGNYTWDEVSQGSGLCLGWLGPLASGTPLTAFYGGCPSGQFYPTALVGPGAASYAKHQMVNYLEFGRCADITDTNPGNVPYISYPCKQDPTGNPVDWNQAWVYNEPTSPATSLSGQQITVIQPGAGTICLQSPASPSNPTPTYASGNHPFFNWCSAGQNQSWTRVGYTNDWATSYVVKDFWGNCLDIDQTPAHFNEGFSTIVVATCSGANSQKWNAQPQATNSNLGSYQQVTG